MSQKFLSSIKLTGLTGGSILKINADGVVVEAVAGTDYITSVSAGNLDSLTDVVITNPSADQILVYGQPIGGEPGVNIWYNKTPNYLTPASSINALGDVSINSVAVGNLLSWNGSNWVNWAPNYLTSYTETDPIYTASSWYTTTNNASNWDTAYGWGNHDGLYANAVHTHSVFTQATSGVVNGQEVTIPGENGFVPASGIDDGGKFLRGDGTWQVVTTDLTGYATETWVGQQGYLTSYTETDPVFAASDVYSVRTADITNWNTAFGWGDHSEAGYLTTYTETDPIYTASSWYTTTNNASNWDTAYGWGNHAGLYIGKVLDHTQGWHSYAYPDPEAWYTIAKVVLNGNCQSQNLFGEYRDLSYYLNTAYKIHITARAECNFLSDNEAHTIRVNIVTTSTNKTGFGDKVRVVLTRQEDGVREYELQYYRTTWDTGRWELQRYGGWIVYDTSQTAGTEIPSEHIVYNSNVVASNFYASNGLAVGTTSPDSVVHLEGSTSGSGAGADAILHIKQNGGWNGNEPWALYVEGYSYLNGFRVNAYDGPRGLFSNAGQLGFAVGGDYPITFAQNNETYRLYIASGGNVGIGTTSPSYKLDVSGQIRVDNGVGNGSGQALIVDGSGDVTLTTGGSLFFGAYDYAGSTYIRGYDNSAGLYLYADGFNIARFGSTSAQIDKTLILADDISLTKTNVSIYGNDTGFLYFHGYSNVYFQNHIIARGGISNDGGDVFINDNLYLNTDTARIYFNRPGGAIVGSIGWHSDDYFYVAGHPLYGPYAGNHVRVYGFGDNLHFGNINAGDVATINNAGTFTYGGSEIATQSWVTAQGYITSETDSQTLEWNQGEKTLTISNGNTVDLSQMASVQDVEAYGFITGESDTLHTVTNRGTVTSNTISVEQTTGGGFVYRTDTNWGGWARNGFSFANGSGTVFKGIGAYGDNGNSLSYIYVGNSYSDNSIRIYGSSVVIGNTNSGAYVADSALHVAGSGLGQLSFEDVGVATAAIALKSSAMYFGHQSSSVDYVFKHSNTYNGNYATTGTAFAVISSSGNSFINSGNLGIGTTSPSTKLHVAGNVRVNGNYTNRLDLDANVRITGQYYGNSGSELTYLTMYNGNDASINIGTKHSLGYISFESGNGAYTERMRITNTGNVGIGTTSPSDRITVGGNIGVEYGGYLGFYRYPGATHTFTTDGFTSSMFGISSGVFTGRSNAGLVVSGYDQIRYYVDNVERMRIAPGGNVGIGTTSPNYKLDVDGNIHTQSIVIGRDTTYGDPYRVVSFGYPGNGTNRIFAANGTGDGMYFAAASNHGFNFRPNGGTDNLVTIGTDGTIQLPQHLKATNGNLSFSAGGNQIMNIDLNGKVYPQSNNANDLGFSSSLAWRNIYAHTLFTNTAVRSGTNNINDTYGASIFGAWTADGKYLTRNWHHADGATTWDGLDYITYLSDAPVGSTAIRSNGAWQGQRQRGWTPIDRTKTYKVSVWFRTVSGNPYCYASLTQAEYNLNQPDNGGWGNPYFWNGVPPTEWTEYTMTIGPSGSGAQYTWASGTRYAQVGVLLNYLYDGYDGEAEFSSFKIEELDNALAANTSALGHLYVNGGITSYDNTYIDGHIYIHGNQAIDGSDSWLRLNQNGNFSSGVYTPGVLRNDGNFVNYGGIYGYANIQARKAQTAGNYTTAALWTESYDNTTTGIAFHISGNVGKFLEMRTDGILYWNGDTVLHSGNYSSWALPKSGGVATGWVSFSSHTQGTPIIKAVQEDASSGYYLFQGVTGSSEVFRVDRTGNIYSAGNLVATQTWVSAQGYAVQQDITEAVSALVNSAPDTLDTLQELAAALGNDENFATTVTNSLAGKMPYYHGATYGDATNVINGVTRIYPTANDGPIGNGHFTVFTALQDNTNYGWQFTSVGTTAYYRSKDTSYAAWQRIWSGADFSSTNVTNWDTAYGWGNHATANYWVTSNTDPQIVAASSVTFQYDVEIQGQLLETSSIRFKENIVDLEPVGDKVSKLRPVRYNKIGTDVQEIGLIAEEVAELFPEVVHYNEDGEAESLNYTRLSVLLLQTVKELSDRIQKLENK